MERIKTTFFLISILLFFPQCHSHETKTFCFQQRQRYFFEELWDAAVTIGSVKARHGVVKKATVHLSSLPLIKKMEISEPELFAIANVLLKPEISFDGASESDGGSLLLVTAKLKVETKRIIKNVSAFINATHDLNRHVESFNHERYLRRQIELLENRFIRANEASLIQKKEFKTNFQKLSQKLKAVDLNKKALKELDDTKGQAFAGQAMKYLNRAITLYPEWAELYYNRGKVHYRNLFVESHLEDLQKVLELDPGFKQAYEDRAMCYLMLDRHESALENAQKACEMGDCDTFIFLEAIHEIFVDFKKELKKEL